MRLKNIFNIFFGIGLVLLMGIGMLYLSSTADENVETPADSAAETQWRLPEGAKARLGKGKVLDIAYSPDSTRLAVASSVGLWVYETTSYREIALCPDQIGNLTFSPDSSTIAGMSFSEATVHLWDAKTGKLKHTLPEHFQEVTSMAFSGDGETLATGSQDDTICLWDVKTGSHKRIFTGHTDSVLSIAFSPDSTTLATASNGDGTPPSVGCQDGQAQTHLRWTY